MGLIESMLPARTSNSPSPSDTVALYKLNNFLVKIL